MVDQQRTSGATEPGPMWLQFPEAKCAVQATLRTWGCFLFAAVPAIQPPPSSPGSLRDSMLKEPDSHSSSSSIQPQQQLQRPDAPVLILPPQHQTPTTLPDSPSDAEQSEDNKPSSSWVCDTDSPVCRVDL